MSIREESEERNLPEFENDPNQSRSLIFVDTSNINSVGEMDFLGRDVFE